MYTIEMRYESGTATAKLDHGMLLNFVQTLTTFSPGKDWELVNHTRADNNKKRISPSIDQS